MEVKEVGVLGAGTVGAGIAQVCAEAGLSVVLMDVDQAMISKAIKGIEKAWQKAIEKGKLDEAGKKSRTALLSSSVSNNDFSECDVVIEAIV